MAFTPFDFNEIIHQRQEHAREGLRYGSPVVAISCSEALAVLTVRRSQRKIFEIYDRLIYSAIGNQSDIEAVRLGAVDVAAREGYERSPDDVTAQRLVGFALSPALKEIFRDQFRAPSVIRALFGELGETWDADLYYVLNFDGEFSVRQKVAVVAGTIEAEDAMYATLDSLGDAPTLSQALPQALRAWASGVATLRAQDSAEEEEATQKDDEALARLLQTELEKAHVEVGLLDRVTERQAHFRLLTREESAALTASALKPDRASG